jgi:hypothetical protein
MLMEKLLEVSDGQEMNGDVLRVDDKEIHVVRPVPVKVEFEIVAKLTKERAKVVSTIGWIQNAVVILARNKIHKDYNIFTNCVEIRPKGIPAESAWAHRGLRYKPNEVDYIPEKSWYNEEGGVSTFYRKYYSRALKKSTRWEIVVEMPKDLLDAQRILHFNRMLAKGD